MMYILQGDHKDLVVSDQFYYFELMDNDYENLKENIDVRYYLFAMYLRTLYFFVNDPYLVYLLYTILNGLILTFACRNFKTINICFFSFSFLYLSHGLLRDQLLIALSALLSRSPKFLVEIFIILIRVQLVLLISYRNRILDYLVPSVIFAILLWLQNIHVSVLHIIIALQSILTLPGFGFFTIEQDLPLNFVVVRMVLGFAVLAYWLNYFLKYRDTLLTAFKMILILLSYAVLAVPVDIRIFVVMTAMVIGYDERARWK